MITVRIAKTKDLSTLLEFEQGVIAAERPFCSNMQDGKFHYYDIAELMARNQTHLVVAEVEDDGEKQLVAAGYADIRDARHFQTHDKISYLGFMYVSPKWRGQGLNKLIMDALFDWSHKQGLEHFVLDVFSDNEPAQKAYEKVGFKSHLTEMILHKPSDAD